MVDRVRPVVIVHAAAQSNVDYCELHPDVAWAENVEVTRHLLEAAQRRAASFIYVSTDYVFDGLKGTPYAEGDPAHPGNRYGQTKWEGEALVRRSALRWLIVRVSTLFGPGRETFVDTVIRRADAGQPVQVLDQTTSPTYTVDAAEGIARLIEREAQGLVHLVNDGAARRDVLARAVLEGWGCPQAALEEIRLIDKPLPARRPPNSSLAMTRVQTVTGWSPQRWETALQQYLAWKKRSIPCNSAS